MPAYLVIGAWILIQVAGGYGSIGHLGEVGGVAYLAHIGGAAAGLVVPAWPSGATGDHAVQAEAYRDAWSVYEASGASRPLINRPRRQTSSSCSAP